MLPLVKREEELDGGRNGLQVIEVIDSTVVSRKEGGHLASIDSQEVQDYFAEKNLRVWIGGSDQALKGTWTWSDCTSWNWTSWDTALKGAHQVWPNQPDNYQVADYCAMYLVWKYKYKYKYKYK